MFPFLKLNIWVLLLFFSCILDYSVTCSEVHGWIEHISHFVLPYLLFLINNFMNFKSSQYMKCSDVGWRVYDRSLVWLGSPSTCHRMTGGQFMQTRVSQATESCAPWGFLRKLKKDVRDEKSGATMSPSHCLLSFVFFPAFPIILTGVSNMGNAFHCRHSKTFLGAHGIKKK